MTFFFYLLVILGSVQGFVTATLLYTRKPVQLAHQLLAAIIVLIALPGIHLYGHHIQFFHDSLPKDLIHAVVPWVTIMAVGPLLYFYTRATLDNSFRIKGKDRLHFLPVIIDRFPKIMELVFLAGLIHWQRATFSNRLDTYNLYADIPRFASFVYYVYRSGQYIKAAGNDTVIPVLLTRFINALKIFAVIWFLYMIPYLIPSANKVLLATVGWFPVYIPLAVLIYWVGISAFYLRADERMNKRPESPAFPRVLLEETAQLLTESMRSAQLYLDPSLDLSSLSETIHTSTKLISATVNQVLNRSFNQFVNEYRVEAFKRRVLEPDAGAMTIPGLAASCGFSSTATFQRSFKQLTGLTPTEFLRTARVSNTAQIRI